jgi:hypothetical protein
MHSERRGTRRYHPTPARSDKAEWITGRSPASMTSLLFFSIETSDGAGSGGHHNCARPQRPQTGEWGTGSAWNAKPSIRGHHTTAPHLRNDELTMPLPACSLTRDASLGSRLRRLASPPHPPGGWSREAFRAPCACRGRKQPWPAAPGRQQKRCEGLAQ